MPTHTAHALEKQPTAAPLENDLHALVTLAARLTEEPENLSAADVAAAAGAARSPSEYLDAVAVMIGFNFITRVANALGVDLELPPWIRRIEAARHLALKMAALLLRWLVDLRPRRLPVRPTAANLRELSQLFTDLGLESLPDSFYRLEAVPYLLETLRDLLEALLRRDGTEAGIQFDKDRFMVVGLIVLQEIRAQPNGEPVAGRFPYSDWAWPDRILKMAGETIPNPESQESVIGRFARDVTRWSYRITPERIDELRSHGLRDEDILDLVTGIALWNSIGRLEILLVGLPPSPEPEACLTAVLAQASW
jgi:alkylhydroperoxidase family enzyme